MIQRTVAATEEVTSPELVLVAPPEIAARAREALPDYEFDVISALNSRLAAVTVVAAPEETTERELIEPESEMTVGKPLPSYELERNWPWYDVEPKPLSEPIKHRPTVRIFALAVLAMVLLPVALLLLVRYAS